MSSCIKAENNGKTVPVKACPCQLDKTLKNCVISLYTVPLSVSVMKHSFY